MPPKVSVSTTLTTDVVLQPKVKAQLRVACMEMTDITRQIKALKAKQDVIKASVELAFINADEGDALMNGIDIDGFRVKLVCGTTTSLDKKKLVDAWVDPAVIQAAMVTKDKKPYVSIKAPGERDSDD